MSLLLVLLAANAIMHGIVVARFGIRNNNQPFLVFAFVYAAGQACPFRYGWSASTPIHTWAWYPKLRRPMW